ncbi:hypothetical protein NQ317_011005 [Molorchus minor]|uniref:Uncharacterized protein n=1 Tax=Molorchus minor TaxID=1323400 RepID=A0ABQ9K3T5_9CUCU|nr:hypothetical protein NQ317_011005 [Molorchus minor]
MIHHRNLLRTNSDGEGFSAPIGNYLNDVDCGITALPWLTKCLNLEKCAKFGVFVTVLSLVGFFHGIVLNYFRGTSNIWSTHYNIPQNTVDWFIYTNEVFAGLLALCVAYWGNRIHRASWMGGLTMLLAVAAATLAVPEVHNPFSGNEIDDSIPGSNLCNASGSRSQTYLANIRNEFDIITFSILTVFQLIFAMATMSFITHGMTYIDDHISPKHSPGFIGLAMASNLVGKQIGIYCSWAPYVIDIDSIFVSPVWIVICILTFIIGLIIAMFPKVLPNVIMMKSVNSLLSLASGNCTLQEEENIDGFFKSLWRILKNKILLINIFSLVLIESALVNFSILQKDFYQSKYHVSKYSDSSGYSDPFVIQFTTNLLKHPMVAISVVTSGMVVSKIRPKAKYLVIWNMIVFGLVALFFSSTVFFNCANKIENEHSHTITIPFCSSHCGCNLDGAFQPVCVDKKTYFSPCLAGCKNFSPPHNMYSNCSCGQTVTEGSCDAENCKIILALSLANGIISSGLLATTVVSNMVINLRCVSNKDKPIALGLEYTCMGIIPYLPIRAIYYSISETFCEINGLKGCQFYSEYFPIFISIITIVLMLLASILAIALLFFIGDLELYKSKSFSSESDLEIVETMNNQIGDTANDVDSTAESGDGDVRQRFLRRDRQLSEVGNLPRRRSKEDRMNSYLSEGDLVPPLKIIKRADTSTSKNSGNSGLSTDSLKAIASVVGDDHDSDTFSEILENPQQSKNTQRNIVETEF